MILSEGEQRNQLQKMQPETSISLVCFLMLEYVVSGEGNYMQSRWLEPNLLRKTLQTPV